MTAYLLCSPTSLEQFIFNTSFNFNHKLHCPLIRCVAYVKTLFRVLHVFLLLPLLTIAVLLNELEMILHYITYIMYVIYICQLHVVTQTVHVVGHYRDIMH